MLVLAFSATSFAADLADGVYEGYSDAAARSFNYVKMFVEDGKISAVILREFTDKHVEKDFATYSYTAARDAMQGLGQAFVDAQGPVDTVSGATSSSKGFNKALERAIAKASGNTPDQTYFDGTFLGRSHNSARGYYEVVWVTLQNDKVTDLKVQRIQPDYTVLDPADYNYPLEAAREQYKEIAANSTPGQVDTISGATGLTTMLNIAVQDALSKAVIQ